MTFPSLFQTLPSLVIEMVIEYLLEHPRNSFDVNIEKHNAKKAVLTPLLRFRGPWREAALVSICDNCKITIDCNSLGFSVEFPAWPADYSYVGFCKNNLVK
ncbi:hypothetical protein FBU31_005532 [Coemansia sp. 'formosensis']|nr:hypothetical protein FBU31_005532 [Coemansia sp. 'formosensis']